MKNKMRANRGAVLPIILLVTVLTQITFYSILHIYRSQMELNSLLVQHYQSQAILTLAEINYKARKAEENSLLISFNVGEVKVTKENKNTLRLESRLLSSYQEEKTIPLDE